MEMTILLLEDEENLRRGIRFKLEKEGKKVLATDRVSEGKKLFEANDIQLIICDITLTDGSGLDFCNYVRQEMQSDVRFMFLTAMDQELDVVMGYEAGADDYMTKPFSLAVLLSKINAMLKRAGLDQKESSGECFHSGKLAFYPRDMRLMKGEEPISLTKNECRILQLFLNHPKQILSKQQILEQIFDLEGNFVDENTVAVNICRLRDKITVDGGKKDSYIKNVRGMGYIWNKEVKS